MNKKRIGFFSSYFDAPKVPQYIFQYLKFLRPHIDKLVYVTTDDKVLTEADLNQLYKNADDVVFVKNEGYDFGMWQKILYRYEVEGVYDELCLVNDSCVCFDSLFPYFEWHALSPADITGMTISLEVTRHLQSFFLCVKAPALPNVIQYIKQLQLSNVTFEQVVNDGELGLSAEMQNQGFYLEGYWDGTKRNYVNPMYDCCIDLIDEGVPLIKKKLFTYYSSRFLSHLLERTGDWRHVVLLNQIQLKTGISDNDLNLLFFDWRPTVRHGLKTRWRLFRRIVQYRVKKFFGGG